MKESEQRHIFQEWLKGYRGLLFKIIRAYAFNSEDRDDLFQEVCLQVYRSIPNFKGESAVSTWIYRIALNTAITWSTRERRHMNKQNDIANVTTVLHSTDDHDDARLDWLYSEIKQLNEIDRSLILLLLSSHSYREISEITGISESNIGVKIHRIKKQLANNAKQYKYD